MKRWKTCKLDRGRSFDKGKGEDDSNSLAQVSAFAYFSELCLRPKASWFFDICVIVILRLHKQHILL